MPWPDIFFPKKRPENSNPPPLPAPPPEAPKIQEPPPAASTPTRPPSTGQSPRPSVEPLTAAAIKAATVRAEGTRTLPVMHGVVLRPLTRSGGKLTFPVPPTEPIKNIEQLMTEADPVKTLSQTGSVRMLKRLSPEAPSQRPPGTPPPIRAEDVTPETATEAKVIVPPKAIEADSPWPSFASKDAPRVYIEPKKPEPDQPIRKAEPIAPVEAKAETPMPTVVGPIATPVIATPIPVTPAVLVQAAPVLAQPRPVTRESTFLTRPAVVSATPAATRPPPPSLPPMILLGSIAKRKAKLADVARIVLPPKREETGPLPPPPASDPSATETAALPATPNVVAPSTARLPIRHLPKLVLPHSHVTPVSDSPFMERAKAAPATTPFEEKIETKPVEPTPVETKAPEPEVVKAPEPMVTPVPAPEIPVAEVKPEVVAPAETPKPEPAVPIIFPPAFDFVPKTDFEAPKLDPSLVFDPATMPKIEPKVEVPKVEEPKMEVMTPAFEPMLQLDPEAHKTAPDVAPKLDPEAHKPSPPVETTVETEKEPATSTEIEPTVAAGTREFHLTNGERVAGVVLSESADTLYVQHASLGVLTIPRDEIATRLAEIILINGDRIVGNIMAETADTLYVRHASLGMLSVPKAQRSRRVVEAILKNGDRILGEVLTETDTFTVIKSATLGTVTIPHDKVNMLNRKIEQIEMKALPSPALQG